MFYNEDFRPDNNLDGVDININNTNMFSNTNNDNNYDYNFNGNMQNFVEGPIVESGTERCVQRNILHEVRHICPINTRIINNHIYRHTYQPHYTCCEENVVTNEQCGSCCQFK